MALTSYFYDLMFKSLLRDIGVADNILPCEGSDDRCKSCMSHEGECIDPLHGSPERQGTIPLTQCSWSSNVHDTEECPEGTQVPGGLHQEVDGASSRLANTCDANYYQDRHDGWGSGTVTTLEKIQLMSQRMVMSFSSPVFEEMRKLDKNESIEFVPASNWEADVTFYIRGKAAVYRQDASFYSSSFEALVEKLWAAHQEVYEKGNTEIMGE